MVVVAALVFDYEVFHDDFLAVYFFRKLVADIISRDIRERAVQRMLLPVHSVKEFMVLVLFAFTCEFQ